MAFRIQGQKDAFDGVIAGAPANAALEEIAAMVDWSAVRGILARGYDASGRGYTGIDPVVLFKMLLLEQLYNLSDVQVSVEAADRLSFRRFLGLSAGETAPDDTTLVKFRARLRGGKLLEAAHAEVARQIAARGLSIRPGAIKVVDATVIRAATRPPKPDVPPGGEKANDAPEPLQIQVETPVAPPAPSRPVSSYLDTEAAFGGKKGKLRYGYKLHTAVDAATGAIAAFDVTPANVADTTVFGQLLDGTESCVLADKGYDSARNREALGASTDGIMRRVAKKGATGLRAALNEIEKERNRGLSRLRSPSEGVFCALKRYRRLGRAVYTGLVRVREQATLAVTAHNLLKAIRLVRLYA
jgi:IS5 family transposase